MRQDVFCSRCRTAHLGYADVPERDDVLVALARKFGNGIIYNTLRTQITDELLEDLRVVFCTVFCTPCQNILSLGEQYGSKEKDSGKKDGAQIRGENAHSQGDGDQG